MQETPQIGFSSKQLKNLEDALEKTQDLNEDQISANIHYMNRNLIFGQLLSFVGMASFFPGTLLLSAFTTNPNELKIIAASIFSIGLYGLYKSRREYKRYETAIKVGENIDYKRKNSSLKPGIEKYDLEELLP